MTDKRKAAALSYDIDKEDAPRLVAQGQGSLAEKIIEVAKLHNVPIYEDPQLVEVLCRLNVGDFIPPELFEAVAEVLAFIYKLETGEPLHE
jgi:flagellar biosynthesis protein